MKRRTTTQRRKDRLYPRVTAAVHAILERSDVVHPIDVFVEMDMLRAVDVQAWNAGKVQYLERVVQGNLSKIGRILRILDLHARDRGLARLESVARPPFSRRGVRYSKSGDGGVERAWGTGFQRGKKRSKPDQESAGVDA